MQHSKKLDTNDGSFAHLIYLFIIWLIRTLSHSQ